MYFISTLIKPTACLLCNLAYYRSHLCSRATVLINIILEKAGLSSQPQHWKILNSTIASGEPASSHSFEQHWKSLISFHRTKNSHC